MIFHENCLRADNSYEISNLIFYEIKKDVIIIVVCCSCDWRFKGLIRGGQKSLEFDSNLIRLFLCDDTLHK